MRALRVVGKRKRGLRNRLGVTGEFARGDTGAKRVVSKEEKKGKKSLGNGLGVTGALYAGRGVVRKRDVERWWFVCDKESSTRRYGCLGLRRLEKRCLGSA
jgi:hypothetical protein